MLPEGCISSLVSQRLLREFQATNEGILLQGRAPCWSASLCQADSTPKSLTWTDNRKNSEVQRRCDLLKVTKYLLAEFRPDWGATKDTSAQGAWRAQSV